MVYQAFSYCIFASTQNINHMNDKIPIAERNFLMDGTFKIVPMGEFSQLFIIAVEFANTVNIFKHI
jgi:hypothetical protein